jgi:orotate phosphoribosyltransferase
VRIVELVRRHGHEHRDEPFLLASGQWSHDYVDGKRAVANGADLRLVAETIIASVTTRFDAVGGVTMGADPLAHAVAVVDGIDWFSVRKLPKGRGLNQWIEGCRLRNGTRVLLVDDVVTTGGSIFDAHRHVIGTGAEVVAAVSLVDRGDVASADFEKLDVPYMPLVTYRDLRIEPVGRGVAAAASR